ncbi:MAG: hypothetical protein ACQZ3N_02770 [cyanobacterium endosymbiont of Rhopalodia yunnanensis]
MKDLSEGDFVSLLGETKYVIRIQLHSGELVARGLTTTNVIDVVDG